MSKCIRLGAVMLCLAVCAAVIFAPADSFARNEVGKSSFFAYLQDSIFITSNCLSEKQTQVLLPEWTPGSGSVTVEITLSCQGGDDSGTVGYRYETTQMDIFSLKHNGIYAEEIRVADCASETLYLTIRPKAQAENAEAKVQVWWKASTGTQQAEFILPILVTPEEEADLPAAAPATGSGQALCYRSENGIYQPLGEGTAAAIWPSAGHFPAFTGYSEDSGETWTILAYESDCISVNAKLEDLRLRGQAFAEGMQIQKEDGSTLTVDKAGICAASLQTTSAMPVISQDASITCQLQLTGVRVGQYQLMVNGTLCSIQQSNLSLEEQAGANIITISAPKRAAEPGVYTLVIPVYSEDGDQQVDKLQATFFVNYR